MKKKITKTDNYLINALFENLELLNDAVEKTTAGDFKYLKVIKNILRILVHRGGMNKPLLCDLAAKYSIIPMIKFDNMKGLIEFSLDDYLEDIYFISNTEGICLKNKDLIAKSSQQDGGAHEDWALDADYAFSKCNGFCLGGTPPEIRKLVNMGKLIYISGNTVLKEIKSKI